MVELDGGITLTWTIGLHDGIRPRSSFSTIPGTTELDSDPVACGRFQVHQSDRLAVTVHWVKVQKGNLDFASGIFTLSALVVLNFLLFFFPQDVLWSIIGRLKTYPFVHTLHSHYTFQVLHSKFSFFLEVLKYIFWSSWYFRLLWKKADPMTFSKRFIYLLTYDWRPRVGILGRHVENLGRSNGPVTSMRVYRLH